MLLAQRLFVNKFIKLLIDNYLAPRYRLLKNKEEGVGLVLQTSDYYLFTKSL